MLSEIKTAVNGSLDRIQSHPFIEDAHSQSLTKQQATRWILCAGRESRSFPLILKNLIRDTKDPLVKQILQENLADEYGNGDPKEVHFHHYLHLLDELQIPRSLFDVYEEDAGINFALQLAYNVSLCKNRAIAFGYMLVNEGMTQITYSAARTAFEKYFPDMHTPFFDIHIEVDAHHVDELYRALAAFNQNELKDIKFGVSIGERGMATLLDEAYGVFDHCDKQPKYPKVTSIAA